VRLISLIELFQPDLVSLTSRLKALLLLRVETFSLGDHNITLYVEPLTQTEILHGFPRGILLASDHGFSLLRHQFATPPLITFFNSASSSVQRIQSYYAQPGSAHDTSRLWFTTLRADQDGVFLFAETEFGPLSYPLGRFDSTDDALQASHLFIKTYADPERMPAEVSEPHGVAISSDRKTQIAHTPLITSES